MIEVALDEKPSTAYLWRYEIDPAMLRLADEDAPPAGPPTGASRRHTFRFEALRSGATTLALRKTRAWEPDRAVEEFVAHLDISHG
jgi:predicted secreted protein